MPSTNSTAHTAGRLGICNTCGAEFPRTKNKTLRCNACTRLWAKQWRDRRKAEGNPVTGTQMPREWRREADRKLRERPEVKERLRIAARRRLDDPVEQQKAATRRKTRQAIETGALIRQPCRYCGVTNVQAHHPDYSNPYDVQWLCPICHTAEHRKSAAKGGAS